MANDLIRILLEAEIGKSSIENIKSQIEGLSKVTEKNPIKINIEIDKDILQQVQNLNKTLAQRDSSLTPKIDTSQIEKGLARITNHFRDGEDAARKQTKTTIAGYEKTVELLDLVNKKSIKKDVTYDFTKEQKDIQKNTEMYTKMFIELEQKEQKSIEAIADAREKSAERVRKESEKAELAQSKAANKALDDNYKLQQAEEKRFQKLNENIQMFQKRMLSSGDLKGEMDIFAGKYKGKFNETEFGRIADEIKTMQNLPLEQQQQRIKGLSIEWSQLKQTAMQSGSVISRTIENMTKFMRYYIAGGFLVGIAKEVKSGINSIKELDVSLTELGKISELSSSQMKLFTDRAYDAGKTLARTGKEVVDATVEFRRAGSDLEEAFVLGQKALLLTNVGSGIDNVVDASSSLIAIMKGFKMEAQDTNHVIDALNEVSNNYALDTVNLTEILKRTSGTLAQTGMSFEQLLGLSVGGFESLRSAEQVASGLNMISQRLKGMNEDGSRVEGLIPKIQEAFDKYAKGAVSVIDKQNGGLNSTFEILQQLSKVYPTLTDEQRAYINEAVAGNRQNKVLVAVMENWNNVEKAINSANNSMGSAEKSNAAYLDSIEGRTKTLVSTMQSFWNNFINADIIKGSVSSIAALVSIFDKLINNSFSQGIIITGLLAGSIVFLNSKLVLLAGTQIAGKIIAMFKLMTTNAIGFSMGIAMINKAILASPLFVPALIIGGITAVIVLFDKYGDTLKNLKKRIDETTSALNELQGEYDSLKSKDKLTEEQQLYLKLLEKEIERKKESLALDSEMLLQREFLNKETIKGGGHTVEAFSGVEQISQSIAKLEEYKKQLKNIDVEQEKGRKQWDDISKKIREIEDDLNEQFKTIVTNVEKIKEFNPKFIVPKEIEDTIAKMKELFGITDDVVENTDNLGSKFDEQVQSLEELTKEFENVTDKIQTYNKMLSELNSKEGLSAQSKEDIISKYQNLLPYLDDEQRLRRELIAIIQQEEQTQRKAYADMIVQSEEFFNAKIKGNDTLVKALGEFYTKDLENAKSLADAKRIVEESLVKDLSGMWAKYYNVASSNQQAEADYRKKLALGFGTTEEQAAMRAAINAIDQQKEVAKRFEELTNSLASGVSFKDINMSKSSKDKKDNRQFLETIDAEIRAIKIRNDNLIKTGILLEEQLKTAKDIKGIEGLNKQYEITGQIIAHNEKVLESFKEEQDAVHKRANELRKSYSKYNTEAWFDSNAEQTQEYIKLYNSATKKQQEEMSLLFNQLQKLKKAWMESGEEVSRINNITKELEISFSNLRIDIDFKNIENQIKSFKDSLSDLDYEFKLLGDDQIIEKTQNLADKMGVLADEITYTKNEIDRLSQVSFPEGSSEAQRHADKIAELTKNLQDSTLAYNDFNKQIDAMREKKRAEYIAEQNKLYDEQQKRISALNDIQEKLVAIIRKRGEEERKALDEAYKAEMDSLEKRHKERTQKYKDEADAFKKMIQDKLDALDRQNAEEDYLDSLNKEKNRATELQKQIDVLSLDDSLTARNQVIKLRKDLAEQNEKIAKTQRDRENKLLKESLQDQLKNREQNDKDKEDIANKSYENEKKRLEEDYKINKEFLDKKYSDDKVYAEAREAIMRGQVEVAQGMFMDIYDAFEDFEDKFGKGMGILGDIIKKDFIDQLELAKQAVRDMEYLSQNIRPKYDSDVKFSDDEIGWKEPNRPNIATSEYKPDYGKGAGYGKEGDDNEHRLNTDPKYRADEINRTEKVIRDRLAAGMDVALQERYLKRLISGSYKFGGKITDTGVTLNEFHGTKSKPEWILNDWQLKTILKDAVDSALKVNLTIPKVPNSMAATSIGGLSIEKLIHIEGNVDEKVIPELQKAGNDIAETLKSLNKGGVFRPIKI